MIPPVADLAAIAPQLIVLAVGMIVLLLDGLWPGISRRALANLSILGLVAAGGMVGWQWPRGETALVLNGMVSPDAFTAFLDATFILGAVLSILLSVDYIQREGMPPGEYLALILFATLGMMVMASAMNLITVFLGLEILSIALYILAGYQRDRLVSEEAALKYFLLGAFASAFFLYGIALTYGATQSLNLQQIRDQVSLLQPNQPNFLLLAGVSLMIVGFGFKVAVFPFHVWTPDVYEGAPTPVTAFMSVGAKAAGFAALLRVLTLAFPSGAAVSLQVSTVLASVAAMTMVVGNVVAIAQRNIKRMLAYSSIAHAGYILVGVVASLRDPDGEGISAVLFYTLVYTLMNLGAFGVILALRKRGEELLNLDDLGGLGFRYPVLGALMALFMLSLAGMPPTAGFFGKLYLLQSILNLSSSLAIPWLAIVLVLTSVVSFYYYVRVITNMYMEKDRLAEDETELTGRGHLGLGLAVTAIGTILLGILPGWVLALAHSVGQAIHAMQNNGMG